MSPSISAIGNGNKPAADPTARATRLAAKMMKDLDSNQDGHIDQKEFVNGLAAKGVSAEEAAKQFEAIDTRKTGSIGKADIAAAIQSGALKPPVGGRPSGDKAEGGERGGGKPARAGGAGAAGGAAANKTYDPADTNQDGKVSEQEARVYSQKQAQQQLQTTDPSKLGNNVDQTV
jgi:Ca2+-binding EF-hand superfamily protein